MILTFRGLATAGGDLTAFVDAVTVTRAGVPVVVGDPGFELPKLGTGKFAYRPTGSPWAFVGNAGVSADASGFTAGNPPAPEGAQVAFLQGTGSFEQPVPAGDGTITIAFQAAQRANHGKPVQDFAVLVDGVVVATFKPTSVAYRPYTIELGRSRHRHPLALAFGRPS